MSCNLSFQNQNQESSDGTQVPDGDGLSDTRIHKDGNDEKRDHAVSIMLFYIFCKIRIFFCNSWLIVFAIYLYVYRRKEMTLKRRHSRTRVQTQVPPPQHAPNPQSSVLGATSEVTQLGPLFYICSNSQQTCLHFCDLQCCNLCVYRRKQMRMRRSHPITRRQMNASPRTRPKPRDLQVAALQT